MRICRIPIALLGLVCFVATAGTTPGGSVLDRMKAQYENASTEIRAGVAAEQKNALGVYGQTLRAYAARLRKLGDLDNYTAIDAEQKRFMESQTVLSGSEVTNPLIRQAADAYKRARDRATAQGNAKQIALIKNYQRALSNTIKRHMQADNLEQARLVNAEADRVTFELAVLENHAQDARDAQGMESPAQPPEEEPKRETTITLSGVSLGKPRWKPTTINVRRGQQVTLRAEPLAGMTTPGYTDLAFRVRIGTNGEEHEFTSKGQYTYKDDWQRRYKQEFSYTADADGRLFYIAFQKRRFRLHVTVD